MMRRREFLTGVLTLLLCVAPAVAHSEQRLRDFARVVIADDALPVQKTAAEELALYAGKMTGRALPIVFSSLFKDRRDAPEERAALLKRASHLGEQREQKLLAHRDWPGPDEGHYAFTNDSKIRRWHTEVKKELGIDKPSALTKQSLAKPKGASASR